MKKIGLALGMLLASNLFMNVAWYGHLKYKTAPLYVAILASWGIALIEYCFQVPANRIGSESLSLTQLKVIQEVMSLSTFVLVAAVMYRERPTPNQWTAFALIGAAAYFAVKK